MNKKLSIIIPQFSEDEAFMKKLFVSLSYQIGINKEDVEIIIVGDKGYKLDINKTYPTGIETKYIYSEENAGAGVSRNIGIENSEGEWVMFLDADDMLYSAISLYIVMHNIREDKDVLFGRFISSSNGIYNMSDFDATTWIHSKVYKRKFIDSKNIRFSNLLRVEEDGYFNNIVFGCNPEVVRIQEPITIWIDNKNSITRGKRDEYVRKCYPNWILARDLALSKLIDYKALGIVKFVVDTIVCAYYATQLNCMDEQSIEEIYVAIKRFYKYRKNIAILASDEMYMDSLQYSRKGIYEGVGKFIEKQTFSNFFNCVKR